MPRGIDALRRMSRSLIRCDRLVACVSILLCGCVDRPASLDQHLQAYEKLAQVVAIEVQPGQIVNYEDAHGAMRRLMAELDVRRVRHERDAAFILLSGQSNIITGQFSYLYRLSDTDIELSASPDNGVKREHLKGRWYVEIDYFD